MKYASELGLKRYLLSLQTPPGAARTATPHAGLEDDMYIQAKSIFFNRTPACVFLEESSFVFPVGDAHFSPSHWVSSGTVWRKKQMSWYVAAMSQKAGHARRRAPFVLVFYFLQKNKKQKQVIYVHKPNSVVICHICAAV